MRFFRRVSRVIAARIRCSTPARRPISGRAEGARCLQGILAGSQPRRLIDFGCGWTRAALVPRRMAERRDLFRRRYRSGGSEVREQDLRRDPRSGRPSSQDEHSGKHRPDIFRLAPDALDRWQWDIFLPMCVEALADEGTLVATTHGRIAAFLAAQNHPMYGNAVDLDGVIRNTGERFCLSALFKGVSDFRPHPFVARVDHAAVAENPPCKDRGVPRRRMGPGFVALRRTRGP